MVGLFCVRLTLVVLLVQWRFLIETVFIWSDFLK